MKVIYKQKWLFPFMLLLLLAFSFYRFIFNRYQTPGLDINCATIIHYDHLDPIFISTIEMNFRLGKDHNGKVILSGNIKTGSNVQTISRMAVFDYEITSPNEISIYNVEYIKNARDTANDELFRNSFFYAQKGTSRQMHLSPSGNAWLIGNLQSPFALCVNKEG
ncbi:hypothetical protein HVY60_16720 [Citrobacter freundii]|uniref:hypothetical protein n=1 Tax=Citrobacter freundii TaxID=546 RepID=UPI0015EF6A88|nr:hypothetical protein [Citrobacter freundii]QMG42118.1 hypothetical protein HVY60_16720 [Citrobacter freundii]